jgi:hypothetical protein
MHCNTLANLCKCALWSTTYPCLNNSWLPLYPETLHLELHQAQHPALPTCQAAITELLRQSQAGPSMRRQDCHTMVLVAPHNFCSTSNSF